MEEKNKIEDICFEFQQKIIDTFNEQNNIPFLLKYYLFKEIWDSIENNKIKIDMMVRSNHPPKPQILEVGEADDDNLTS